MTRRPYVREVSRYRWYFRQARYLRYMAREITCLFIGGYTLMLIVGLGRLADGPQAYAGFLASLRSPLSLAFHVLALVFALYNTVTWFNVTPKALPVQWGEKLMPPWVVAAAHYVIWLAVSAAVLRFSGVL